MDRIFTQLHLVKFAKRCLPLFLAATAALPSFGANIETRGMKFTTNATRKTATFTGLVNTTRPEWAEAVNIPATFTYSGVTYTVTAIGNTALARLDTKSVTIPSTVTSIGTSAFYGCTFTSIVIPEGVKTIGVQAFMESNLESIAIPSTVTSISNLAFANKTLTTVTFAPAKDGLTLGESVFSGCHRLQEAILPEGLTALGKNCFKDCGIRRLSIPSTIKNIPTSAFELCSQLTEVTFTPGVLTYIGTSAFANTGIRNLVLPEGLNSVGYRAFNNAVSLEQVTFPSTLTLIDEYCFEGCENLKEITLLSTVPPTLHENSFSESTYSGSIVTVPNGTLDTYRNADGWKLFKSFVVSGINDIKADENATALPDEIYTISGIRVTPSSSLPAGVYIIRRGTTVTKTVIL